MKTKIVALFALLLLVNTTFGRENVNATVAEGGSGDGQRLNSVNQVLSGCAQGKTQSELKLNNVRMRLLTCGDMWWDLNSNPKYEVPKGSGSYASFAGSLWFGGYVNGNLKISAMTYRQNGVDFWPGPIDPNTVDVAPDVCVAYDKHFRFNRADVDEFYANYPSNSSYTVPTWIKQYPGSAPTAYDAGEVYNYLAPFVDVLGNGTYDWAEGDYPAYNVSGATFTQGNCKKLLFGDETMFWVFNDKGNIHSESGSASSIGVEIRAQAFQFATADVLNDMTFYNFEIINRSSDILDSTYFAVWVDADLGNYQDDYVGCDVVRGLGYIYNGDNYDDDGGGVIGYHSKLPALGCDFFQGPSADLNDGIDNDRDGCVDCTFEIDQNTGLPTAVSIPDETLREPIAMAKFLPYNNTGDAVTGNPNSTGQGIQFYNYMAGKWRTGAPMRYDLGPGTSTVTSIPQSSYLFPGNSDPNGFGVGGTVQSPIVMPNWTEVVAGNTPGDRRFLQSAGKFTLEPGAINNITFGMPFVRTNSDNNFAAIPLLLIADDKAQSLFDNCFKVLDGPDAPDMTIQEMENQLIFYFSNDPNSNNYEQDRYAEIDPTITPIFSGATDRTYRFEGYMVYQLKDESVSSSELYDENKSRLVFQCDKKNGVSTLINYTTDPVLGSVPNLMTPVANDKGIINSFMLTEDMFAEGNKTLVNHKTYYYMAISYAYNNYLTYRQDVAPGIDSAGNDVHSADGDYAGQKKPFLQGRKNIKTYSAVPHNFAPEANGTVASTFYGYGPKVKRIEGQGNGGNFLNLTESTISSILSSPDHKAVQLEYENLQGPIQVKVIDPLKVLSGNFIVKVKDVDTLTAQDGSDSLVLVMGDKNKLDYGKVSGNSRYQVEGTYTNSAGQSVSKTWMADEIISIGQEQILIGDNDEPIGISITVNTINDPYPNKAPNTSSVTASSSTSADLIYSDISFSSTTTKWLTGVVDTDSESEETNWIRSGTASFGAGAAYNDASVKGTDGKPIYADPNQVWEGVVGGTWAPFRLCAASPLNATSGQLKMSPSLGYTNVSFKHWDKEVNNEIDSRNLGSVDIVFTSDKSKWTRCVVLEMGYANTANQGSQRKFLPRKAQSVDRYGNSAAVGSGTSTNVSDANYISETGMGWFPGYAINVETGERLNIAFGENSSDSLNHGKDMFWNPTSKTLTRDQTGAVSSYQFGGMHYIYVFGHNSDGVDGTGNPIDVPRYDAGAALIKMLNKTVTNANSNGTSGYGQTGIVEAFKDVMWVNLPLIKSEFTGNFPINSQPNIPADAKVRIRVTKPLRYGLAGSWSPTYSAPQTGTTPANFVAGTTFLNSLAAADLTKDTVTGSQNNNFPMYTFSTEGLGAKTNVNETAVNALDIINVVPNPYYGHSKYEKTRIDNYIKIVNLPVKCTIRIYSVNGTLIKTIKKDTDATTNIQWDLKNEKYISVASGLYIIHVDAGDLGEKILKWFCVMRPIDLQSY